MSGLDVSFRVLGEEQLQRELARLPERVRRSVVTTALRKGGRIIVKEARARAPVRTGALRKAIGTKIVRDQAGDRALQVGVRRKTGVFYGHLVEFGHGGPHAAAPHPFLEPAVNAVKDEVVAAVKAELVAFLRVLR